MDNLPQYDQLILQINQALKNEKSPDLKTLKRIIKDTDCPYLLSIIKGSLSDSYHKNQL